MAAVRWQQSGGSSQWRVTYLVGVELFSVHRRRVFDHHQSVVSKTLTVEVLRVGTIENYFNIWMQRKNEIISTCH